MPTVRQKTKQIVKLHLPYVQHLQRFESTQPTFSSSQSVTTSERVEVTNVFCPVTSFMWRKRDGTLFTDDLNEAYGKIVFWRKNVSMF